MHCLDAVLHELRDMRASLQSKIDDSVRDLTTQIHQRESNFAANTARLDAGYRGYADCCSADFNGLCADR